MNQADRVREYCKSRIIEPARARGDETVSIRAGDVHSALGFKNRLPLVCSVLGTTIFEESARVERISIAGPMNGANAVFTFRLM
jgi:5-methylcytosine-specific restriction enzyme B